MLFFTSGKHNLAYRLKQEGPESFVFVHGLGASMNSFDRCFEMEEFRSHTLATIDLPGCGESSRPDHFSYTMNDQADLVLAWIRSLGLTRIVLVGHSMGGVICLYLAEALGTQVQAFFNLEGNLSREDCMYSGKVASSAWEDFENRGFEEFKANLEESSLETDFPGLKLYYKNISRAHPRAYYLSSLSLVKESCEGNLNQRFLDLSTEKWYVFGEHSINYTNMRFLDQHNIPYFIVPESGHFMMDDQPDLFYELFFNALKERK
jgi:pimeloyl-ACP methyl ester carboxylesterase